MIRFPSDSKQLKTLLLVLLSSIGSTSTTCPAGCECDNRFAKWNCRGASLTKPPPGNWPGVYILNLIHNNISSLDSDSFKGFPDLQHLFILSNPLKQIDLGFFVGIKNLSKLGILGCDLETIAPLTGDQKMPNLTLLQLLYNKLKMLPANLLDGLTNKKLLLDLRGNPLIFSPDDPFLRSDSVNIMDLSHVDSKGISSVTFSGLPNLQILILTNASITDVSQKFTSLPALRHLTLSFNPFKEIKGDFLSKEQRLGLLDLSHSQLEAIEGVSIVGRTEYATLLLDETPMACQCKYKDVKQYFYTIADFCPKRKDPC